MIEKKEILKRTRRSFLAGGVAGVAAVSVWEWTRTRPLLKGIPSSLRMVLEWNGKLWGTLYRSERFSPIVDPPPPGQEPRVNGEIGLEEESEDDANARIRIVLDDEYGKPLQTLDLGMREIRALPVVRSTTLLKCIEGWSEPVVYAGASFMELVRVYRLGKGSDPLANPYRYVGLVTPDGKYYVSIDMESMLHPQTALCFEMNGEPLSVENGAPLRLMIPVKYGIKNLKRIGQMRFSDHRLPDYWEERGYDWYAGM